MKLGAIDHVSSAKYDKHQNHNTTDVTQVMCYRWCLGLTKMYCTKSLDTFTVTVTAMYVPTDIT